MANFSKMKRRLNASKARQTITADSLEKLEPSKPSKKHLKSKLKSSNRCLVTS